MAMFKAFKPSGMEKIARSMGYQGGMDKFQDFLATDPARQQQMDMYTNKAAQMAKGGMVKMQTGGTVVQPPVGGPGGVGKMYLQGSGPNAPPVYFGGTKTRLLMS